ncbi:calcium-activated chloride channel regulator 1-like [Ptychodera flava]|uniref:calcium-activated chloride channel regulator 1-like n=1 Tax=Ptychodera flava TaxID=63121 RepID=UPI00396A63A4
MMDFCDTEDNADSSGMVHNYEAPTKQNVGCNYKSVWEVLNDHVDFRDDTNPPRSVASTVPTFKVVKRQCKRTVLVLDISGSMASYGRIYRLEQAVVNYINNDVQDGEYLGMVVFNSTAAVKSLLVEMNDEQRESMLLLVPGPGDVDGATSIGAGLLQGIEVLEQNGQNPNGGILLVVTDGEENTSPFIDDVLSEIQEKLITVDTIAIESEASIKLENLSSTTCGMSFFYSEGSNALKEAFSTSAQRDQEISSLPITLYSNSLTVYSSDNLVFHIDSTIGDKTKIVVDYIEYIGYNDTAIELTLELPDGSFITKNSPAYTLDSLFKIVTIQIPGLAQVKIVI